MLNTHDHDCTRSVSHLFPANLVLEVITLITIKIIILSESESASLAKYVYTYKELDCGFKLLSVLHTVPITIYSRAEIDIQLKTRTNS